MFRQHTNIAALVLLASLGVAATTVVAAPGSGPSGPATGSGGAVTPANARTRLEARMAQAGTRLSGKAAYTSEPRRGGVRQSLSVEVQGGTPGATLTVTIAGREIGTIVVNALGRGKLERRSGGNDAGQIPAMNFAAGDNVVIGPMSSAFAAR